MSLTQGLWNYKTHIYHTTYDLAWHCFDGKQLFAFDVIDNDIGPPILAQITKGQQ